MREGTDYCTVLCADSYAVLSYDVDDNGPRTVEVPIDRWQEATKWAGGLGKNTDIEEVHCLDDIVTFGDTLLTEDNKYDIALYVAVRRRRWGDDMSDAAFIGFK